MRHHFSRHTKRPRPVDYSRPVGLWNVVERCIECGRWMLDTHLMFLYRGRKWATATNPPRTNGYCGGKVCEECALALKTFSKLDACNLCGQVKRNVCYRSDCYAQDLDLPLDMCMSCWNRIRPIMDRYYEHRDIAITCRMLLSGGLSKLAKESHEATNANGSRCETHHNRRLADLLGKDRSSDGARRHGTA